jgi:hypothetical protein
MATLPTLPAGSIIKVEPHLDGFQLSWMRPVPKNGRLGAAVFLCIWLTGWAAGEFFVFRHLLTGDRNPIKWFLLAWLVPWSVGGIFAIVQMRRLLGPQRPSTLVLLPQELRYEAGSGLPLQRRNEPLSRPARSFTAARNDVELVTTAAGDSARFLTLQVRGNPCVIGHALSPEETNWLAALLQSWKNSRG